MMESRPNTGTLVLIMLSFASSLFLARCGGSKLPSFGDLIAGEGCQVSAIGKITGGE